MGLGVGAFILAALLTAQVRRTQHPLRPRPTFPPLPTTSPRVSPPADCFSNLCYVAVAPNHTHRHPCNHPPPMKQVLCAPKPDSAEIPGGCGLKSSDFHAAFSKCNGDKACAACLSQHSTCQCLTCLRKEHNNEPCFTCLGLHPSKAVCLVRSFGCFLCLCACCCVVARSCVPVYACVPCVYRVPWLAWKLNTVDKAIALPPSICPLPPSHIHRGLTGWLAG